jgi:hypothetical protein
LRLEYISSLFCPNKEKNSVVICQRIKDEISGTIGENKIQKIEKIETSEQNLHKISRDFLNGSEIYQFIIP